LPRFISAAVFYAGAITALFIGLLAEKLAAPMDRRLAAIPFYQAS
jgi:hypothetical protein